MITQYLNLIRLLEVDRVRKLQRAVNDEIKKRYMIKNSQSFLQIIND